MKTETLKYLNELMKEAHKNKPDPDKVFELVMMAREAYLNEKSS